ncbi:MAG: DUF721 domain-containing protein [Treponema sp.]|jgi:hypothetical protein|nr:DUF721 domain-containing protein [Treponema sp.]
MKKAGELLSLFFDEHTSRNAQVIAEMFTSWTAIAKEQHIPSVIDHAHIVEFERHIVLIEADHPGWIQILQTKQREFLESFKQKFPELTIRGISFRLSRGAIQARGKDCGALAGYAGQAAPERSSDSEAHAPRPDDILSRLENNEAFKRLVLTMTEGTMQ